MMPTEAWLRWFHAAKHVGFLERYAALLAAESRLAEWCVASVAF